MSRATCRGLAVRLTAGLFIAAAVAVGGCAPAAPEPARPEPAAIGPCVERMHDLAGVLLLYWNQHKELPPSVKELQTAAGAAGIPLLCPVCGKQYAYNPQGMPEITTRRDVVLCDPEPCHDGGRWGITVSLPGAAGVPTARVVYLPPAEGK